MKPNICITLAVDPGAVSGWAVCSPSGLDSSGTAETSTERHRAILRAISLAAATSLPLVVVAESWSQHGRWTHAAQAGTSAQWGRWEAAIEDAPLDTLPKLGRAAAYRGVVRVQSNDWYRALGGSCRDKRPLRLMYAMRRAGCEDPDEACARLIGEWSRYSREVAKVLPVAFRGQR